MKNKSYSVVGSKKQGHRIAVPESTGVQKGDRFFCIQIHKKMSITELLDIPEGSLLYVPGKVRT
jgi:regulator of RNase E activity RraB